METAGCPQVEGVALVALPKDVMKYSCGSVTRSRSKHLVCTLTLCAFVVKEGSPQFECGQTTNI